MPRSASLTLLVLKNCVVAWRRTKKQRNKQTNNQASTFGNPPTHRCRRGTYNSKKNCKIFSSQNVHQVLNYPMKHIYSTFLLQGKALELTFFEQGWTFMQQTLIYLFSLKESCFKKAIVIQKLQFGMEILEFNGF